MRKGIVLYFDGMSCRRHKHQVNLCFAVIRILAVLTPLLLALVGFCTNYLSSLARSGCCSIVLALLTAEHVCV